MKYLYISALLLMITSCVTRQKVKIILGPKHKKVFIHEPITVIKYRNVSYKNDFGWKGIVQKEISEYTVERLSALLLSEVDNPKLVKDVKLFKDDTTFLVEMVLSALEMKIVVKKGGGYRLRKVRNRQCTYSKKEKRMDYIILNKLNNSILSNTKLDNGITNVIIPVNIALLHYGSKGQYESQYELSPWFIGYLFVDFSEKKAFFRFSRGLGDMEGPNENIYKSNNLDCFLGNSYWRKTLLFLSK